MADYTLNKNLYKWKTTDTKRTTITEMSKNAEKIDDYLTQIDVEFGSVKTDLAQKATQTQVADILKKPILSVTESKYQAMRTADGNWHRAFQSAVSDLSALGGGILFLPSNVYETNDQDLGFHFTNINNITFMGVPGSSIIKRTGDRLPKQGRFLTLENCKNIAFINLNFDNNGLERYGGANLYNCENVLIEGNYFYDSALNSVWQTYDHFGFVITSSKNILFQNNRAEDISLVETPNCENVRIIHNTSLRCASSAVIAMASVGNGYYFRDIVIEDNLIIDPRKQAIYVQNESGGANNAEFRRFSIRRNKIIRNTIAGTGGSLRIGNFTGAAATGNIFEDFDVEDNMVYNNPSLTRAITEISINHNQTGSVFKRFNFKNNKIVNGGSASDYAYDLRKLSRSDVSENKIFGAPSGGMQFHSFEYTRIIGNQSEATNYAFAIVASAGNNRIQNNIILSGTFYDTGKHATDKLINNDGLA